MRKIYLSLVFLLFLSTAYAQCETPVQFSTTVLPNSITVTWQTDLYPSTTTYEYHIIKAVGTAPFLDPDFVGTQASYPLTITQAQGQSLQPATAYFVYFRAHCTNGLVTAWKVVNTTTAPINDQCDGAIQIPVNPGQDPVVKLSASTVGSTAAGSSSTVGCGIKTDVWFRFIATNTTHAITFSNFSGQGAVGHSIMTGYCGNLTNVYCGTSVYNSNVLQNLVVGNTYYVQFYSTQWMDFTVAVTSPPSNDNCENAVNVPVNPQGSEDFHVTGSTLGATASGNESGTLPGCSSTDDDIWYTFTATATTHVIKLKNLSAGTSSLNHSVYSGDCSSLTLLYCSNPDLSIAKNLVVGNTYKVRVFTSSSSSFWSSQFELYIITPPPFTNDECANAISLPVSSYSANPTYTSGTITGATSSPEFSNCSGSDDDVWYTFVAQNTTQIIQFKDIIGSDTLLGHALYSGTCGNLTQIYCKTTLNAEMSNFVVGNTYTLRVFSTGTTLQAINFKVGIFKPAEPIIISQSTAAQLIDEVLLDNPCITTSNISYSTGLAQGIQGLGYFSAGNSAFPLDSGIVLSTGAISGITGPNTSISSSGNSNWPGDTQLNQIIEQATQTSMNSQNATTLEFDLMTANAYMSFNFLFASEEYGDFQCNFSDAFAFLLTDLASGITTNLAVVPNTNIPISTVTIRDDMYNSDCSSANAEFFDNYYGPAGANGVPGLSPYLSATNFNGMTKIMTASSALIPNHPYHIKLVVADRQDSQYDSAVFIQAGSFTSGPPECSDKIKLISFVDNNGNGTKDAAEPSFTYGSFIYQLNDAPETNNIASPIGNYTIYDANPANSYDFSFAINPEYQTYFASATTSYNNITIPVGSGTTTLYFPVTLVQGYNDVTVSIIPVSPPVAGMSFKNRIKYTNHGVAAASGTITFSKDPVSTINAISEPGAIAIPGGFTYNFVNLAPFESRFIDVTMSIPPIPTVNINDILTCNATISAPSNDINIGNNAFVNSQIVVASYDPNDKMEAHGEKIQFNTFNHNDYLTYTIRFQNTGTSNAINIHIEDLLDAKFDQASIRMIDASHSYAMNRVDNKITWYFDYIQLPGMIVNEPLSHGYVTFRIKLKPGFAIGDIVPNHAAIYFDTNPAILTNTFHTEFVSTLGAGEFTNSDILIYPNPARDMVHIDMLQTAETIDAIVLFDILGKAVKRIGQLSAKTASVKVGDLPKGVYIIEITTASKRREIKKLVIE